MNPSQLLPDFPRTQHLAYRPNAVRNDLIADKEQSNIIFNSDVEITEKIDGANCGICLYDDQPLIRNRNNFLTKAGPRSRTPAKMQFSRIFTWFYENKEKFEKLAEIAGPVSVYGEWLYALHGISYDNLPDYFVAFDLYDFEKREFLDGRSILEEAGFYVVPLLHRGKVSNFEFLDTLCSQKSPYSSTDTREGLYFKVFSGDTVVSYVSHRFKMVRHDFIQGGRWDERSIKKQKVNKSLDK